MGCDRRFALAQLPRLHSAFRIDWPAYGEARLNVNFSGADEQAGVRTGSFVLDPGVVQILADFAKC